MGRSPCCRNGHVRKGTWTKEEDQQLISYINANGHGSWRALPKAAGLQRCGKSCRLRWINYLRPDLKRGNFTQKDIELIIELHSKKGNKWSEIAREMEGRTDNEIKNYWNTHIKPKLIAQGIDPNTHQPIIAVGAALTNTRSSSPRRGRNATIISQAPVTNAAAPKPPLPALAVAGPSTKHSAEDVQKSGISTDDGDRRIPDLNLALTFSPSPYAEAEDATPSSAPPRSAAAKTICMCCQLGFNGNKGRCGCIP